jgi:hypothetical protein
MRKSVANSEFCRLEIGVEKLRLMKLLPNFYVFTYEGKAKLYAAEKDNDDDCPKTTASSRRPPESYCGADRGIASASNFRRTIAPGSSAPGLF